MYNSTNEKGTEKKWNICNKIQRILKLDTTQGQTYITFFRKFLTFYVNPWCEKKYFLVFKKKLNSGKKYWFDPVWIGYLITYSNG